MRPRPHPSRAGLTLLELLVVVAILTVALGEIVQSLLSVTRLGPSNLESSLALEGVTSGVEAARAAPFDELIATFNADGNDDPDGFGTAFGATFSVPGLEAQRGDADGIVGRVELPIAGNELREDLILPELGMPRDLNGDGLIDGLDHSGDYVILPVRVVVEWRGQNGNRSASLTTVVVPFMDPDNDADAGFVSSDSVAP